MPKRRRMWLMAAAAILASAVSFAGAQVTPYQQLEQLERQYPNLQFGQEGHAALGAMLAERFAAAAQRGNAAGGGTSVADAERLFAEANAKAAQVREAKDRKERITREGLTSDSPWYVHYTLENPLPFMLALALLVAMMYAAWRAQGRKSLLAVAGVCAAGFLILPVAALLVETQAERITQAGDVEDEAAQTTASLDEDIRRRQFEAVEADRRAAEVLRGRWQHGQMTEPSAAFIPGAATLTVAGAAPIRVEQLTPNLSEPANLPEDSDADQWRLFYGGRGAAADLRPIGEELRTRAAAGHRSVVLMEFDSSRQWLNAVRFGADAVIFLEPEAGVVFPQGQAAQKFSESPLSIPRFYARRAEVVAALGAGWRERLVEGQAAGLAQPEPGRWVAKPLVIDWLLIPGTAPAGSAEAGQLVHFQTYRDTASVIPAISPSAHTLTNVTALLRLLEQFERQPPRRPVLLTVVDQHTNAMQGEQTFAYFAFAEPQALLRELDWLEEKLSHALFVESTYGRPLSRDLLEELRTFQTTVAGSRVKSKDTILDRLNEMRNVRRDRRATINRRMTLLRVSEESGHAAELATLTSESDANEVVLDRLVRLMMLFNQIGDRLHYDDLDATEQAFLQEIFDDVVAQSQVAVRQVQTSLDRALNNLSIRRRLRHLSDAGQPIPAGARYEALFAMQYQPVPAAAVFCLDVSPDASRLGFFHLDHLTGTLFVSNTTTYVDTTARTDELAKVTQYLNTPQSPLVDTLVNAKWQQQLAEHLALASSVLAPHTVAALTLTGVQDPRPLAFTPFDSVARVNPDTFNRNLLFLERFFPALIDSADFGQSIRRAGKSTHLGTVVSVRMQERFSTSVPIKPVPGALVVVATQPQLFNYPKTHGMFAQVRPHLVLLADDLGSATVRGQWHNGQSVHAFVYDEGYRQVLAAADYGTGEKLFVSSIMVPAVDWFAETRIAMSEFRKVDLVGLSTPLTLAPLPGLRVYDAVEDSIPRHWAVMGVGVEIEGIVEGKAPSARDGTASIFVEPGSRFKLRLGDTVALNVTEESPKGEGFPAEQGLLRDLIQISYQDMLALTQRRMALLNSRGVSESMVEQFLQRGADMVEAGAAEADANPAVELTHLSRLEQARGLIYRAYVRARGIITDLTTAVIVFMALIIPFCFFVMKLVTPFTDIGRQLGLFAVIFALMVAVLYFVHPAFSLSETPIVVVLAFIILGLAGFVSAILLGRFNASMTQMVEQVLQNESVDASQGRLMEAAFLVGVNNMKRRRIRTSLTTATIILVTFTMLSVISVGQEVDPAMVRRGGPAAYDGFVFQRPGNQPIHVLQMDALRGRYGRGSAAVARAWAHRESGTGSYYTFEIPPLTRVGTPLRFQVLLGLEQAEDGFVTDMPLVAGRWFSSNDAAEVVLSAKAVGWLGLDVADFKPQPIEMLGMKLTLVGVLDDDAMFALRDLGDVPVLPLAFDSRQVTVAELDQRARDEAMGTAALESTGGQTSQIPIEPGNVAFLPIDVVQNLGVGGYRSLSVRFLADEAIPTPPAQRAWDEANRLIRFQHQLLLLGMSAPAQRDAGATMAVQPGQYALMSSTSTQVGGMLKAAIPIILAATIILNTMLGSVLERKREVAIYNAIGLNPGHVIVFFLAESLVFGVVGAVAGYLIGQVLSVAITHWQIVDLNLNYSSLAVILVIMLTIVTVLISTVYPAVMAARSAVPSGQRRWSLPKPEGDQIHVNFPFSYDARRVLGVCAFLHEFMAQNSEASTGKFLARTGPVGLVPAGGGTAPGGGTSSPPATPAQDHAYAMVFDIAPAPFDLGVNQKMEVYACYDPRVRAHMLSVHLTRLSGERSNWVTVNQPFLESLRKRLLGWRSQSAEIQSNYYDKGEQLFDGAAMLPTQRS